jgi:hypothetical protein
MYLVFTLLPHVSSSLYLNSMRAILDLVKELLPNICKGGNLSVLCISTSNSVYLVFEKESCHPLVVLRMSSSSAISSMHTTLEEIYDFVGGLVPAPLLYTELNGNYISIQKGVPGIPWYQLVANKNILTNNNESILAYALSSLRCLHQASMSMVDWSSVCKPKDELRASYDKCVALGRILPEGTEQAVDDMCDLLTKFGEIISYPQHGDFCINNLLFDKNHAYIIDFEDFGLTYMPLYDQFTLALSLYGSKLGAISIAQYILDCTQFKYLDRTLSKDLVRAFFLYHLLFRIGAWSNNREDYRFKMLMILEDFLNSPEEYISSHY